MIRYFIYVFRSFSGPTDLAPESLLDLIDDDSFLDASSGPLSLDDPSDPDADVGPPAASSSAAVGGAGTSEASAAAEAPSAEGASAASAASTGEASSSTSPRGRTAQEERHLYESVSVEEVEEPSEPGAGGLAHLLQGIVNGINDLVGFEDIMDDDFSSYLSGESTPPQVLSVQINGEEADLADADASDWETDEDGEEAVNSNNTDNDVEDELS